MLSFIFFVIIISLGLYIKRLKYIINTQTDTPSKLESTKDSLKENKEQKTNQYKKICEIYTKKLENLDKTTKEYKIYAKLGNYLAMGRSAYLLDYYNNFPIEFYENMNEENLKLIEEISKKGLELQNKKSQLHLNTNNENNSINLNKNDNLNNEIEKN